MLSGNGAVIEGDKYVALQAQQVWAFAWLYNALDAQPAWLEHALHGATFLSRFASDDALTYHAQLDRRGRPITQATDSLPGSYAVMAYAQLHRATQNDEWAVRAKRAFANLLQTRQMIRNDQNQSLSTFRQLRHLSEPMIVLKATLDMKPLLDEESWKDTIEMLLQELLHEFVDRRTDTLREFILPEGSFVNTPEGRRLNVGLTFQTAGYLLDATQISGNRKLATQVVGWCLRLCDQAWEDSVGGLNQHVDMRNQPIVFPDWQQKWAWVHLEALSALAKGYFQTRHSDCPKWFRRIHDYTFQFFPDSQHTGWHLAIGQNRQPLLTAKAIPLAGCFSLIKCLAETAQTLTKCHQLEPMHKTVRTL